MTASPHPPSVPLLLTDPDLELCLPMSDAIRAVRGALIERAAGTATSLERRAATVGDGRLVMTPGGYQQLGAVGLRLYTAGYPSDTQLTAAWSTETTLGTKGGQLLGLVAGDRLGIVRTAAIGGVAFSVLAPTEVPKVAVIGTGAHGRAQLDALRCVREVDEVSIFQRRAAACAATAVAWSDDLGCSVTAATSAQECVEAAAVVILATSSTTPVISAAELPVDCHVSSLGPKYTGRTELDPAIAARAGCIACDFPEQYLGEREFILHDTPSLHRIQDLAALHESGHARAAGTRTLFLSHGLAGTEVACAVAAIQKARALGAGIALPI